MDDSALRVKAFELALAEINVRGHNGGETPHMAAQRIYAWLNGEAETARTRTSQYCEDTVESIKPSLFVS